MRRNIRGVSHERLTRHELTWLLAQEARGAAKNLRHEVVKVQRGPMSEPAPAPVETSLDALDDAIEMLSTLNTGSRGGKARRGRIDLAALVFEAAPNARLAIEPGAGTEVFGDEADLRRMINLLVTQAAAGASQLEVKIRRQGDWVRLSVELGPEVAASGELERRWLSRMATRHGGWFELEGGTQSILLQADGASDQREVHELRKELEQAQQLGEAYARELAAALTTGEIRTDPPPQSSAAGISGLTALTAMASAVERLLKGFAESARADASLVAQSEPAQDLTQSLQRRSGSMFEIAADLAMISECPTAEASSECALNELFRAAASWLDARASKRGVALELDLPKGCSVQAPPQTLALVLRLLLDHAVSATPRDGAVRVMAFESELSTIVTIADGGPPVPEAARAALLRHAVDPASIGRPLGVSLVAARVLAAEFGAELSLREGGGGATAGATEVWLSLRSTH